MKIRVPSAPHRRHTRLPIRVLGLALVAVTVLAGCAQQQQLTPPQQPQQPMDPIRVSALPLVSRVVGNASPLSANVTVQDLSAGLNRNSAWVPAGIDRDFEQVLESSLKKAGLWAPEREAGKYMLLIALGRLHQPLLGTDITVTVAVNYSLVERSTGRVVLECSLSTPYTAAWATSRDARERARLAGEGAVRLNIEHLIDVLLAYRSDGVVLHAAR
jgi:hypothetical protein